MLPFGTCDFRNMWTCSREKGWCLRRHVSISFPKSSSVQLTEIRGTPVLSGEGFGRTSWLPGREGYVPEYKQEEDVKTHAPWLSMSCDPLV